MEQLVGSELLPDRRRRLDDHRRRRRTIPLHGAESDAHADALSIRRNRACASQVAGRLRSAAIEIAARSGYIRPAERSPLERVPDRSLSWGRRKEDEEMGISPIALTWLAREQARARIKPLKDAADFPGRDPREADDMRMKARLLEAEEQRKHELIE
jgi:hypothetical protein